MAIDLLNTSSLWKRVYDGYRLIYTESMKRVIRWL